MNENFNKFKKKIILEKLIKALVIGFSIGLLSFSAPLLYYKIYELDYNVLYLILIGISAFLVVFAIMFLILKPSKVKVAKRIDKQLNMNEKVQTMVEYENEDSYMITLQREDTLDILSKTSLKKLSMKLGIFIFVLLFIACGVLVTAFAYPTKEDDPNDEQTQEIIDPDYDVDDWTIRALKDLIKYVEDSTVSDKLKVKYLIELNVLLTEIENADKNSEMESLVFAAIDNSKNALKEYNTNDDIYEVLKVSRSGAISDLAIKIYKLEIKDMETAIDNINAEINGAESAISELNQEFEVILFSSELDKEEELYKALYKLSTELNKCIGKNDILAEVTAVVNAAKKTIIPIIEQQKINDDVNNYIEERLLEIFGLSDKEISNENNNRDPNNSNDNNTDDNNEGGVNEGGLGTGKPLYGSDDTFFDPEKGEVVYGDVISAYYGLILGKLNDGTLPESYKENFDYYFKLLFGTLEENE